MCWAAGRLTEDAEANGGAIDIGHTGAILVVSGFQGLYDCLYSSVADSISCRASCACRMLENR